MHRDRSETPALAEEAAHWLIELEEPGDTTLRRFAEWLETSPRHVEEFLMAAAVWKELDSLDTARRIDIQTLVDEARRNVRPLQPAAPEGLLTRAKEPSAARLRRFVAAAALAVVGAGLALWVAQSDSPHTYATDRGEQRTLKLEDGSVVYLNTDSRVEVRYAKRVRAIRLLEGEAMFNVEHDSARPFRVTAGATVIQAIGTRFNVYRSEGGETVSVVEGIVQISPDAAAPAHRAPSSAATASQLQAIEPDQARVSAGEQARISLNGAIVKRAVPDLAQVVAWRERRLVFRGDPLEEVAAQFNRYNAVQIHVEGDSLRSRQITGVFDADDPRSLLQFLERDGTLAIEDGSTRITVRLR